MPGWNVDTSAGLCLATRFDIVEIQEMDREAIEFAGGAGTVVTYTLDAGDFSFYLTNLYLDSPREGLGLISVGRLGAGHTRDPAKIPAAHRRTQSGTQVGGPVPGAARGGRRLQHPSGEPVLSGILVRLAECVLRGRPRHRGTRLVGWIRPRIDHVVADHNWTVVDAWIEPDAGSDHLPSAATLRLKK